MSRKPLALLALAAVLAAAACSDPSAPVVTARPNLAPGFPWPIPMPATCNDTIFKGDFWLDSIGLPPGPPWTGSWTTNTSAGSVRVASAAGTLTNKPVVLRQLSGLAGGVGLYGYLTCKPAAGHALVYWRSEALSSTVGFATVVLRDASGRIFGWLGYYPGGVLVYNGTTLGVTWTTSVAQLFHVQMNLSAHTTDLSVDGVPVLSGVPNYDPAASNLARISMELGGTSAQIFAWDDVQVVAYPW